jgi:hypothetical protein
VTGEPRDPRFGEIQRRETDARVLRSDRNQP